MPNAHDKRLTNSIIEMFNEGKPSEYIAKVLQCNRSHVSTTITKHLHEKMGVAKRIFQKPNVQPFVLITSNEGVLNAYRKMIAYDKF